MRDSCSPSRRSSVLLPRGGIADYWWYRSQQLPPVTTEVVKNASLRMNDCISYRLRTSNITYAELLEKLQKDITEIDSKMIDLRSVQTNQNAAKLRPLLDYLHSGIEVLRLVATVLYKELACTSGMEQDEEAQREYAAAPSTSNEYQSRRLGRARDENKQKRVFVRSNEHDAKDGQHPPFQRVRARGGSSTRPTDCESAGRTDWLSLRSSARAF